MHTLHTFDLLYGFYTIRDCKNTHIHIGMLNLFIYSSGFELKAHKRVSKLCDKFSSAFNPFALIRLWVNLKDLLFSKLFIVVALLLSSSFLDKNSSAPCSIAIFPYIYHVSKPKLNYISHVIGQRVWAIKWFCMFSFSIKVINKTEIFHYYSQC